MAGVGRLFLRIACTVLLACTLTVATGGEAEAATQLRVLQFNMSGSKLNGGTDPVADDTARSINSRVSHVVTLNEICYSQFRIVQASTGLNGYFSETNGPNTGLAQYSNRCTDGRFGNALLVRSTVSNPQAQWLPDPSTYERRKATCALASTFAPDVEVCVTHTATNSQIFAATDYVNGFPVFVGRATIFGGDFNNMPDEPILDQLYAPVFDFGHGHFGEIAQQCGTGGTLDRCGAYTFQANPSLGKIDYIWSSAGGDFCCRSATVTDSLRSDHRILSGTQNLQ